MESFKQTIKNIPGWHTRRKIVVIESDDWGAERTPSNETLNRLRRAGFKVDKCHYMLNDSLASEEDLSQLYDVLFKYKDYHGNHPVITANCLMANPDFMKIKAEQYQNYHFEDLATTFSRYPKHNNSLKLWIEGKDEGLFHPQSHGREHLNISRWMIDLQRNNQETRIAFDLGVFGVSGHIVNKPRGSYLGAFDGSENGIIYEWSNIVTQGLALFEEMFGYKSMSFIAPNYIWDSTIEQTLFKNDVRFIQGASAQRIPNHFTSQHKVSRHYQGQKNKLGQRYLVRNVQFEPASSLQKDWVNTCLFEINKSFKLRKPAVINSHRVNYIGFINPKNRERNLQLMNQLLKAIINRWPDVEFLSSDQLGNIIDNNSNGK